MRKRLYHTRNYKELIRLYGYWPDCPYCETPFYVHDGHVDHIVSIAGGGSNASCNKVLVCADCNKRKQCMSVEVYAKVLGRSPDAIEQTLVGLGKSLVG